VAVFQSLWVIARNKTDGLLHVKALLVLQYHESFIETALMAANNTLCILTFCQSFCLFSEP